MVLSGHFDYLTLTFAKFDLASESTYMCGKFGANRAKIGLFKI
jgi:hypothetical protein